MTEAYTASRWSVAGASVQGAAHVRTGLPNQDALAWLPESGAGVPRTLAVADGHGSAKCFRSGTGAQLAVQTATQLIPTMLSPQAGDPSLSACKRLAQEQLPQELVRHWQRVVEQHLQREPFSAQELENLEERDGLAARQSVEDRPLLAYGTTLLSVLVTEAYVVYWQLGDGDILAVTPAGEVYRPAPGDERLFANETTSLCAPNAWADMRCCFQTIVEPPPALIVLATDGYANSFRDEAGFLQAGADFLELIRLEGLEHVHAKLEDWLTETTQAGSGDDITLGLLYRADEQHQSTPPAEGA